MRGTIIINVPVEMEEAAYVDGCGTLKTFFIIMLPEAKPILTSCFLFSFVWQWTDGFYSKMVYWHGVKRQKLHVLYVQQDFQRNRLTILRKHQNLLQRFDAPMTLVGLTALSVDIITNFLT